MKPLSGKVAIVTGASAPRGIGSAVVRRLAADGASIIAIDISGGLQTGGDSHDKTDLLNALSAELLETGSTVMPLIMDVALPDDIQRCVTTAVREYGRIDILVNNAGSLAGSDDFLATTPDQWETSFRVNILGPMMLSQAVIPEMRNIGGGRIINIGSTGSLGAEPGFGAYTVMKHGLVGMTKTIAAEFGVDGILCNIVCQGYIMTDMHEAANERLAKQAAISIDEVRKQR